MVYQIKILGLRLTCGLRRGSIRDTATTTVTVPLVKKPALELDLRRAESNFCAYWSNVLNLAVNERR
jgi:hypothetical protein